MGLKPITSKDISDQFSEAFAKLAQQLDDELKPIPNDYPPMIGFSKWLPEANEVAKGYVDERIKVSGVLDDAMRYMTINLIISDCQSFGKIYEGYIPESASVEYVDEIMGYGESCAHQWQLYDSGFSRFEFCTVCDEKRNA